MKRIKKLYIHFRNSPTIIFALGVVSTFAIERLLSMYSTQLGTFETLGIAIVLVILVFLGYELLMYLLERWFAKEPLPVGDNPEKHKALLLLLGLHSEVTATVAIKYHLPVLEVIWLLTTEKTKPVGKTLESKLSHEVRFRYADIATSFNPEATRAAVMYAVDQLAVLRYEGEDIICDIIPIAH